MATQFPKPVCSKETLAQAGASINEAVETSTRADEMAAVVQNTQCVVKDANFAGAIRCELVKFQLGRESEALRRRAAVLAGEVRYLVENCRIVVEKK